MGEAIGKEVFHRVFNGDDMQREVLVQPLEASGQGGGFTGAGGSGDQDQAGGALKPFLEKLHGQAQLLHGGDAGLDTAEDGTTETELAMEVNTEADAVVGDITGIVILGIRRSATPSPKIFHPRGFERGSFHGADDLAESDMGYGVFAKKQVGSPEFPAGPAEVLEVIHMKIMAGIRDPGNLHFQRGNV